MSSEAISDAVTPQKLVYAVQLLEVSWKLLVFFLLIHAATEKGVLS
jgi:hypothetical protein